MSSPNNSQQAQSSRSPSVEITESNGMASAGDNQNASQPEQQPGPSTSGMTASTSPRPMNWDTTLQLFETDRGPRDPPSSHVQMNQVAVSRQDLTQMYGSATYPPLDYGDSFAAASMPHLPEGVRRNMTRLHPSLRRQEQDAPNQLMVLPSLQAPPQASNQPTSSTQGPDQTPPAPFVNNPIVANTIQAQGPAQTPRPPVVTASGSSQAPPSATTPSLRATNTTQPPAAATHHTANARNPGESHSQTIQRIHSIDIDDLSRYANGTASIPQDVQNDVNQIKGIKKNGMGYPIRAALKEIREHFLKSGGKLRVESSLWAWYGDTRLFNRQEWYYLATDGIGGQVP